MIIDTKLVISKSFPAGMGEIKFGHYTLRAVPSSIPSHAEAILTFENEFKSEQSGGSHPEEESSIVAHLLSLFWNSRIEKHGSRIGNIDIPSNGTRQSDLYPQFCGNIDPERTERLLDAILSFEIDLARQFVRASNTYSFSLQFIPSDPTFAFFLLVVSIECLSSQDAVISYAELSPDSNKCERYCRFIKDFLLDEFKGEDERDDVLFSELLKTIYYSHRSGFAHGGKEVSIASIVADSLKSSYIKHSVDERIVRTPGLGWFAKIVQGSLIGFLTSKQSTEHAIDKYLLSKLAFEKAGIKLQVNKDVTSGQVINIGKDTYYR